MDLPRIDRFRRRDWEEPATGTVELALIGLGEFTREWVAPSVAASEYASIGAVVSGSPEIADGVAETYDARVLSYETFLAGEATEAYDAVYVATPNATHPRYVRAAADQHRPVLCEKPLAATLEEARDIVNICTNADVMLQVAYRLQTDPVVRWARSVIRSGAIGPPRHAQATMAQNLFEAVSTDPEQWRLDPDVSGGGALIDLGIYPLNTLRFLCETDPLRVMAMTDSDDDRFEAVDERVALSLRFEGGLQAACTASQYSARGDHLELIGEEGRLTLSPAFFGDVTARIERGDRSVEVTFPEVNEMREQLDYFASHVLRGATPEPDGQHGLVDLATIDAAYQSARKGTATPVTS